MVKKKVKLRKLTPFEKQVRSLKGKVSFGKIDRESSTLGVSIGDRQITTTNSREEAKRLAKRLSIIRRTPLSKLKKMSKKQALKF